MHGVSPIKQRGATQYLNCSLQKETGVVKSVCFAVDKKELLENFAIQKSPVKIRKFTLNNRYGTEDVVIGKATTITPTEPSFSYKSLDTVHSIGSLNQVALGQLIPIKAKVTQLSGVKKVMINRAHVSKQEGFIVDPTGFIKLVLWGTHVNSVEEGDTYFFNKVRVKELRGERYLNTPKTKDECTISQVEEFTTDLPAVDNVSTIKEIHGEIVGVVSIEKYIACTG